MDRPQKRAMRRSQRRYVIIFVVSSAKMAAGLLIPVWANLCRAAAGKGRGNGRRGGEGGVGKTDQNGVSSCRTSLAWRPPRANP